MFRIAAALALTVWVADTDVCGAVDEAPWSVDRTAESRTVQTGDNAALSFDRFAEHALLTLFHARAAVGELGGASVMPEHLLLGLLRASPEAIGRFVRSGSTDELIRQTRERMPVSNGPPPEVDVPLAPEVDWILRRAVEEADSGSDRSVRVEHVMLGLLEQMGEAARVLEAHGVRESDIRAYLRTVDRR